MAVISMRGNELNNRETSQRGQLWIPTRITALFGIWALVVPFNVFLYTLTRLDYGRSGAKQSRCRFKRIVQYQ